MALQDTQARPPRCWQGRLEWQCTVGPSLLRRSKMHAITRKAVRKSFQSPYSRRVVSLLPSCLRPRTKHFTTKPVTWVTFRSAPPAPHHQMSLSPAIDLETHLGFSISYNLSELPCLGNTTPPHPSPFNPTIHRYLGPTSPQPPNFRTCLILIIFLVYFFM